MGLDYNFELYFPREELCNVLQSLGQMAKCTEDHQIDFILPDRKIRLPFTSSFESEPIYYKESMERLNFDMSLYFELDNAIEQYVKEHEDRIRKPDGEYANWVYPRDEQGRVSIGYIYLFIWLQPQGKSNLIGFDFVSSTPCMGRLFTESISIRQAFVQLLQKHNGVYGHIRDSDYVHEPIIIYPPNCKMEKIRELFHNTAE